jgi:hypothetical protein
MPFLIQGRRDTLLSTYVQVLKEDVEWINNRDLQHTILYELKRLLTENLDEVERLSVNPTDSFIRIGGSTVISLAFSIKRGRCGDIIQISDDNKANAFYQPNFHLVIWVFKAETGESGKLLPIEDL